MYIHIYLHMYIYIQAQAARLYMYATVCIFITLFCKYICIEARACCIYVCMYIWTETEGLSLCIRVYVHTDMYVQAF